MKFTSSKTSSGKTSVLKMSSNEDDSDPLKQLAQEIGGGIVQYNDFVMEDKLGKGGFGEVYKATHTPTDTVCAVKRLFMEELDEDDQLLYTREIEILAKCRYPFLLHLLGYTITPPYIIVTPFIPNGSLYDYVCHHAKRKRLSPTQKTLIAMGISYGMMKLHEMDIIHRDLKSLNVLIDQNMLPWICDFGIARTVSERGAAMTRDVGTSAWMAPEQMTSHHYDNKVDTYSFAMVLYEMMREKTPFHGMSVKDITDNVVKHNRRPKLPETGNENLRKLIEACWHPKPNKRPSFKRIFKYFTNKDVMWDDTDVDAVDRLSHYIHQQSRHSHSHSHSHRHSKSRSSSEY